MKPKRILQILAILLCCPAGLPGQSIPTFTTAVASKETAKAFRSFVDKNRGKVVHIAAMLDPRYSKLIGETAQSLFVQETPCDAEPSDCAGSYYVFSGRGFSLTSDQANRRRLVGYFEIGKDIETHQGEYFNLKSVPAGPVPK